MFLSLWPLTLTVHRQCQSKVVEPVLLRERKNTIKLLWITFSLHLSEEVMPAGLKASLCVSRHSENTVTQETSGADKHNDHNTWVWWLWSLSSAQHPEERKGETGGKGWRNECRRCYFTGFSFPRPLDSITGETYLSLFSPFLSSCLLLSALLHLPARHLIDLFFPLTSQEVNTYVPRSMSEPHIPQWAHWHYL